MFIVSVLNLVYMFYSPVFCKLDHMHSERFYNAVFKTFLNCKMYNKLFKTLFVQQHILIKMFFLFNLTNQSSSKKKKKKM